MFEQLASYGVGIWLLLLVVAFLTARYLPLGVLIGHLIVTAIISVSDFHWIRSEMRQPGWQGEPDLDLVFTVGLLIRILLVNALLLPVSLLGWRLPRKRSTEPDL